MTHSHLLRTLTTSTLLLSAVYSPLVYAADDIPPGFIEETRDNNDQADELIKRERQDITLGTNVPTATVSKQEAQKALDERKKFNLYKAMI
nr:hypothetical protein [Psychrobacter sp. PraFG1]UNK05029.1 hypothetical protein MN210_13430 [Psychrobacter sp. PraFG1]